MTEKFRELYENLKDGVSHVGLDGYFIECNVAYEHMVGYTISELLNRTVFDITPQRWHAPQRAYFAELLRTGTQGLFEKEYVCKDGRILPVELTSYLSRNKKGDPDGIWAVVRDISDRRLAEETLRQREEDYRLLFSTMLDGFAVHEIICDSEGRPVDYRFLHVNPAFERITGLKAEATIGKRVREVLPGTEESWIERYGRVALTGEPMRFSHFHAGLQQYFDVLSYRPREGQFACIFSDVTDRVKAEQERARLDEQMQHAQKLESLGVLAGGIAHDFNNLLMGILGNADLARSALTPHSPAREPLTEIETAARRAAELCRQMLAYSGRGQFVVQPLNVTAVVREIAHLLEISISKKAVLRYEFAEDLPAVDADATQLRQVIMNLITNASDAIGDKNGVIYVKTGVQRCDRSYLAATHLDEQLAEGEYVYIEVADTGCGMEPATKDRIFDPFFTTKFVGRGLGLAAVLGIVRGHNGAIKVYSELGRGTAIKVLIPASSQSAAAPEGPQPGKVEWKGEGVVLVVDDEPMVRTFTKRVLENAGFSVITAEDGKLGVEVFRQHMDQILLVLLDMTMPGLDGKEVFREIRRMRPGTPVILSSGYNEQEAVQHFAGKGLAGFLQKPYQSRDLLERIRAILER